MEDEPVAGALPVQPRAEAALQLFPALVPIVSLDQSRLSTPPLASPDTAL